MKHDLVLECGEGWRPLIERTYDKLSYVYPDFKVLQIKEKFGELRFYISHEGATDMQADILGDIVDAAETRSTRICEDCGSLHGRLRDSKYWVRTLCPKHALEQGYEIQDWEKEMRHDEV